MKTIGKTHIEIYEEHRKEYPTLDRVANVLSKSRSDIIGRDGDDIRKGLSNPEKANVLILGEPGTGKAVANDEWLPVADSRGYILMGDVKVGDYVYDENGQPTKVIGVYPQGLQEAYNVRFVNDTTVVCNDEHLWSVRTRKQHYDNRNFEVKTLRNLLDSGIIRTRICKDRTCQDTKWYVPKAGAIIREEKTYGIHPYVIGALLGDGCLTVQPLVISSNDEFVVSKVATLLQASGYEKKKSNYSWEFLRNDTNDAMKFIQPYELAALEDIEAMMGKKSHEKRIPPQYLLGSVEQRIQLLQGLMDTDGSVSNNERLLCRFSTSSEGLAQDVETLAFSLGMTVTIQVRKRVDRECQPEYEIHFSIPFSEKRMLFSLPRKLDILYKYENAERIYNKHYDDIGIKDVVCLNKQVEMTCIRVEAPSHLFQVTKSHIVTHNTASVRGFAYSPDTLATSIVLEVNPELLITQGEDKESAMLVGFRKLVEEAGKYSKDHDVITILFIDEFHKIVMYAPSAIEALKPILEKSAANYFRIIASTTFKEYSDNMAGNRAFDQRFLRLTLPELSKDAVLHILTNTAYHWGLEKLTSPTIMEEIYVESKSLLISNAQPRASLDILQAMVAEITKTIWVENGVEKRSYYTPQELGIADEYSISRPILKRAIKRMYSVDIDRGVDVKEVIHALNTRLFNQEQAIATVTSQLEMAAHNFGELDRPKVSFLSTGSTGVGKPIANDTPVPIYDNVHHVTYKQHGDLQIGDLVFNRNGECVEVTAVFQKGCLPSYRFTFDDDSSIVCADEHLWTCCTIDNKGNELWRTISVLDIIALQEKGESVYIPNNQAIQRPYSPEAKSPYDVGFLLAHGCIHSEIQELFGVQVKGIGHPSIPDVYMSGSIEQRWELVRGLFDRSGHINIWGLVFETRYGQLAEDVKELLCSLGIRSTLHQERQGTQIQYCLVVRPKDMQQATDFFALADKKAQVKTLPAFNFIGNSHILMIESIECVEDTKMSCIMVDDEEHLYQVGKGHIVTHNTELAKIISETMSLPLKRFDMSRYASDENATDFADDLFHAAWSTPNAYLLIDEVEKSSRKAMNILLQVLDDARLNDSTNSDRVASFSGNIINLTTNLGSEVYQNMNMHKDSTAVVDTELIYKALSDAEVFETAVLGLIDAIVPFQPLPFDALMKIAKRALQNMIDTAETDTRRIIVSDDVIQYIVKDRTSMDSERGGARDVKRNVKNLVVQVLAHYLTYAKQEVPVILYIEGRPRFKYKDVADPLNAHVALKECYAIDYVNDILTSISKQVGKPLVNRGLYLPNDEDVKVYIQQIIRLASQGHNKFDSIMDGETCIIRGVA